MYLDLLQLLAILIVQDVDELRVLIDVILKGLVVDLVEYRWRHQRIFELRQHASRFFHVHILHLLILQLNSLHKIQFLLANRVLVLKLNVMVLEVNGIRSLKYFRIKQFDPADSNLRRIIPGSFRLAGFPKVRDLMLQTLYQSFDCSICVDIVDLLR